MKSKKRRLFLMDELYFNLALQAAWPYQGQTLPNPAVGAVILDKNNAIIAIGAHQEAGGPHAEIEALKEAYYKLSGDAEILGLCCASAICEYLEQHAGSLFHNTTLYVTLEPCVHVGKTPSCAMLLARLKPKQIIIGAKDVNVHASGGAEFLQKQGIIIHKAWEIQSLKLAARACENLLYPFARLAQQGKFVLYKYASRLDGSIDGGQISSKEAQSFMHNLRSKCDLLLISGKSVRLDRPRLDVRHATLDGAKAPDVMILSHKQASIDTNWPLFGVPNRKVSIASCLPKLDGYIFCEGGREFFLHLLPYLDAILLILNPSFKEQALVRLCAHCKFSLLHSERVGEDLLLWLVPSLEKA